MKPTDKNNYTPLDKSTHTTLHQVAHNIDDIIWKLDLRSQKFTYISPSVKKIRGVSAEEAMKASLNKRLPTEEYEKINRKIQDLLSLAEQGKDFPRELRFETQLYNAEKEFIWLGIKATLLYDETTKSIEAIGVSRDITHEKNYQIELEKSLEREKFFANIIRNSSQPIAILYLNGSGTFINDAGWNMIGYTKEEGEQLNWSKDLSPPHWQIQDDDMLRSCIENKSPINYKKEYYHKNGSIIKAELLIHPKFDSQNQLLHFVAFIKDITEFEETKEELSFANERLSFALKGANDGIWDWDIESGFHYMSPRYLQMLGYKENEAKTHIDFFNQLIHDNDREQVLKFAETYKNQENLRTESTFRLKHKDGHNIPILSRAYKIFDELGNLKRIVGTITDLSEIYDLKNLLKESEKKYKYLFDQSNIGIGISTIEGKLIEANQYMLDLLGISKEESIALDLNSVYKNIGQRKNFISLLEKDGEVKNFHTEVNQKQGNSVWVSISSKKLIHKGKARLINAISNIDKQIKSEQKLKESEERFKQLSKLTTEGILIHQEGKILDTNDSLLNMLGYTRRDFINKKFHQFCCPDSNEETEIDEALNSSYQTIELKLISKTAELIPVEVSGRTAYYQGKRVQVTSFLDIRSRLESERRIQLLDTAIEQSDHAVIITDEKGHIEYVNPTFTEITKYESVDVLGKSVSILESGHHESEFYKGLWNKIYSGETWKGEFINVDKNGDKYWASSTITPIKNKKGVITNFMSVMEDISQRKKEKEEFDILNTKLKLAVEAANFGFWEHHIDLRSTFWDDNMYDFFETNREIHPYPFEYFTKTILHNQYRQLKRDILYGLQQKNVIDVEISTQIKGEQKVFKNYILANPAARRGENSIIGITYDITQQKKFEAELIEKRQKAEESDQLKSAFLANMSHEIRTPLNGIIGFTSLMVEEFSEFTEDELKRYLSIISDNGTHLLNLLNDIIDLSKIDSNQLVIAKQDFTLGAIVSKLEETFRSHVPTDVELIFSQQYLETPLKTDSTRLTQILTNIISNALKFTTKGSVKVHQKISDKFIEMSVEDTGSGIKEEAKSVIFKRFAQGQPIKDQLLGGTGLGLSITKGLVKLLGGNIWFESIEGKGSTFYFKILLNNS